MSKENAAKVPDFDPLIAYGHWFMEQGPSVPLSPIDGVTRVGNFSGLVLHRSGQFQTQMWICDPGSVIPEHSHPNVDSIQLYVSGSLNLFVRDLVEAAPNGTSIQLRERGGNARVLPGQGHSAKIGPMGACFLTFQHWLVDPPSSVEMDWVGEALSDEHRRQLMPME